MSLLWYDNFGHYSNAQATTSGQFASIITGVGGSTAAVTAGVGRGGVPAFKVVTDRTDYNVGGVLTTFPTTDTAIVGMRVNMTTVPGAASGIVAITASGFTQTCFYWKADGTIGCGLRGPFHCALDPATYEVGATSVAVSSGSTIYLEIKVKTATAGTIEVFIDGTSRFTYAGDTDYLNAGGLGWNGIRVGNPGANGNPFVMAGSTFIYNDLYILDSSTQAGPNAFSDVLGDCYIYEVYPTADGNYKQWTPSTGTDHYALVDDNPPNDDTDYVSATTVSLRDSYLYTLPTISSGGILATMLSPYARKTDAGVRRIVDMVRAGGTDYDGTSEQAINIAYQFKPMIRTFDPSTSAEWQSAAVTERGIKVSA